MRELSRERYGLTHRLRESGPKESRLTIDSVIATEANQQIRLNAGDLVVAIRAKAGAIGKFEHAEAVCNGCGRSTIRVSATCATRGCANNDRRVIVLQHSSEFFRRRPRLTVDYDD
jgi:hypothetical protein